MNSHELAYVQKKIWPLYEEHIKWLESRSCWSDIYSKFQKYLSNLVPTTHLVPRDGADNDMQQILSGKGQFRIAYDNDIIMKVMEACQCHENSRKLLKKGKIKYLHTGYALSSDSLWREHSWGVDFDNKIVETTEPRIVYLTSFIEN